MFFRKRYWFTVDTLKKYSDKQDQIRTALRDLFRIGLIRRDKDTLFEHDVARMYELLNSMSLCDVK